METQKLIELLRQIDKLTEGELDQMALRITIRRSDLEKSRLQLAAKKFGV